MLKGIHYTRNFMLRMGSLISWVVVGQGVLSLNDLAAMPLLLSVRHSEGTTEGHALWEVR